VTAPGSPDVYSQNDEVNGSLGFSAAGEGPTATTQGYIPAELLWGTPTWRAAYQLMKAYDLDWRMNNQDSLVREPLTEVGSVEPFAEAMAAGTSFTSNIDRIADTNARYASLALVPPVFFEPISHKRLGSYSAGGATNLGDFTPTREEDGSPTVYGGIGVPEDDAQSSPYIFPVPIFWPSGQPFGLQLTLNDAGALAQAQMQRWLSVTGGSNGNLGLDLNLPPGVLGGFTQTGPGIMDEITLDPVGGLGVPTAVSQGVQLNRLLAKGGTLVIQQGILGLRIPQGWKAAVYAAIQSGAIQAPMGYGTLVNA